MFADDNSLLIACFPYVCGLTLLVFFSEYAFRALWRHVLLPRWYPNILLKEKDDGRAMSARLGTSCVAWLHAVGCVVLAIPFILEFGAGLDGWKWVSTPSLGAGTTAGPCWQPPPGSYGSDFLKVFYTWTLSFGLWDGWECTKNVKRHGFAMLVHAFILCSAHIFVMTNNYEMHALACQMISEASTVFLKPRAIMITLHGNEGARKRPALVKLPFSSALLS